MRILIADDHPEPYYDGFRKVLQHERPHDQIQFVGDAVQAYRALKEAGGGPFDLLILDEQMGGGELDGTALLRRLHDEPLVRTPSIVYITGFFNQMPAGQIARSGTSVTLFLDKNSPSDSLLYRAALLVARQNEGISCDPADFIGKTFIDVVGGEVGCILESAHDCYLSLDQQRVIGSLIRSFLTTLQIRKHWVADDVLELGVFLAEGLCRVYGLPDDIVGLVRKFLDVEEVLYTIPRYRDHFLHQLKVYLLGFCIVNQLSRRHTLVNTRLGSRNAMKLWFITSVFHDLGYPFEKIRAWLNGFVLGVLRSPVEADSVDSLVPMEFNWGALFGRRYNWYHLERIADTICRMYKPDDRRARAELVVGLAQHVAEKPDHGLFSSLILQNFLRERLRDEEVDPVAVAVCLHNEAVNRVVRMALGGQLTFAQDPLSFLLMFCDTAQEWGRADTHVRKAKLVGACQIVFDGVEFGTRDAEVTVYLRFARRWSPREVNNWKEQVFGTKLLRLREVWSAGSNVSSRIGFRIAYYHGETTKERQEIDVLEL